MCPFGKGLQAIALSISTYTYYLHQRLNSMEIRTCKTRKCGIDVNQTTAGEIKTVPEPLPVCDVKNISLHTFYKVYNQGGLKRKVSISKTRIS